MLDRSSIVKFTNRRYYASRRKARLKGAPMTVCVAAMADNGAVLLCASDRMLTKGDAVYEPQNQPKIHFLTQQSVVLLAGNTATQAELAYEFKKATTTSDGSPAKKTIEEFARLYGDLYAKRVERLRNQAVFGKRSLNEMAFLANASRMPESWSRQIDQDLADFQLPEYDNVEAIFVGKDETGSHIFSFENGHFACHDFEGYAVIGSGYNVANSQFVFAKHSPRTTTPRGVYTLYRAKRMAEQSLGVGSTSDWYVITSAVTPLHPDLLTLLEKLYRQERKQEEARFARAEEQIRRDLARRQQSQTIPNELTASPSSNAQQPPSEQSPRAEKGRG